MDFLYEALRRNRDSDMCPMHMPGHKRNTGLFQMDNPYGLDITEIEGFDNLHDAQGILREAMERAAQLWGAKQTWFLINGSSCGVLSAVAACTKWGDEVLIARNSHKSLYNALYQNNLQAHYLCPEQIPGFQAAGGITAQMVEHALQKHPNVKLIAITSPTYEGVVSDVKAIAYAAHARGIPLLVDEAHGAHLGLADGFPGGAVQAGADLVVQSVHKTLPSLTQTAVLHLNGSLVSPVSVERQLSLYESSSPSYVLMASIDRCVSFLREQGRQAFKLYMKKLARFEEETRSLQNLCLLGRGKDVYGRPGKYGIYALDPSKIVMGTFSTGFTGPTLMQAMRSREHVELEMAARSYAIAMTSLCDSEENFRRLAKALLRLDAQAGRAKEFQTEKTSVFPLPKRVLSLREAEESEGMVLPLQQAVGSISRETVIAYPPGIPLIVPGERVDSSFPEHIRVLREAGVALSNTRRADIQTIDTVRKSGI